MPNKSLNDRECSKKRKLKKNWNKSRPHRDERRNEIERYSGFGSARRGGEMTICAELRPKDFRFDSISSATTVRSEHANEFLNDPSWAIRDPFERLEARRRVHARL